MSSIHHGRVPHGASAHCKRGSVDQECGIHCGFNPRVIEYTAKARRPGHEDQAARMIFLTGGAFTPRARAFIDETRNKLIEKPFDAIHLRAIINAQMR